MDFEQFLNLCQKRLDCYNNITHDEDTNKVLDSDDKNESNSHKSLLDNDEQNQLIAKLNNLLIKKEEYIKQYDSYWLNANKKYSQ